MDFLEENLNKIRANIKQACTTANRAEKEITLLAATKTIPVDVINKAIGLGIKCIGENRVQELLSKYEYIDKNNCEIHFIGHLQKNKVKDIVGKVSLIHSVDSFEIAKEISKVSIHKKIISNILVQVNIGKEDNKFGIYYEEAENLITQIRKLGNINIKGLMTIPPICKNPEDINKFFSLMEKKFIDIKNKKLDNVNMDYLSMGMSSDYIQAIEAGSNIIRIGSALFGARD